MSNLAMRLSYEYSEDLDEFEDDYRREDDAARLAKLPGHAVIVEVAQLEVENLARAEAAVLLGHAVTGSMFEVADEPDAEATSLMEATQRAKEGDPGARKLVGMNAGTDVIERTIKAGHVLKVHMTVNKKGQIIQHGQSAQSIQENSLKFASHSPAMRERTEPEVRNMFRIEELNRQGILQDYVLVVFSRAADNMSLEEMHDEGFFTDTMSMAIQATYANADGTLTTEAAFVAGRRDRDLERHDAETLVRLGDNMGVDFYGKTAAQIIDMPVLIRKDMIENGVIDIVKLWDVAAGGTFFGQDKPVQDYLEYLQECQAREAELEPTVQAIVEHLISEADTFVTPTDATRRLHELSEEYMVRRAIVDDKVDSMVFGAAAASFIEGARHHMETGNYDQAEALMHKALAVADSSSCPGVGSMKNDNGTVGSRPGASTSGEKGDCKYTSKSCPLCHRKNVTTWDKGIGGNKRRISGSCGCSVLYTAKVAVTQSTVELAA